MFVRNDIDLYRSHASLTSPEIAPRRIDTNPGPTITVTVCTMADILSWASLWICLVLALVIIVVRIVLRRLRGQGFTPGDYWCMATAGFVLARLISNHFLLVYGSTRSECDTTMMAVEY